MLFRSIDYLNRNPPMSILAYSKNYFEAFLEDVFSLEPVRTDSFE